MVKADTYTVSIRDTGFSYIYFHVIYTHTYVSARCSSNFYVNFNPMDLFIPRTNIRNLNTPQFTKPIYSLYQCVIFQLLSSSAVYSQSTAVALNMLSSVLLVLIQFNIPGINRERDSAFNTFVKRSAEFDFEFS